MRPIDADSVLRRAERALDENHKAFLEGQTRGATGDPVDLEPQFIGDHKRMAKLLNDIRRLRLQLQGIPAKLRPPSLSPAAQGILRALGTAGAIDRDRAKTIASPVAAVKLIDGGFAMKRSAKPRGASQTTVYWLTERGQRAFRALPAKGQS